MEPPVLVVANPNYPKCKYHLTEAARVVANAKEEKELGKGWYDHPALALAGEPEKPEPPKVMPPPPSAKKPIEVA